jgi:hypothetical protein
METMRTAAELEAENADLRKRVELLEDVVKRLVSAPAPPQIVPMPYPVPTPAQPSLPPHPAFIEITPSTWPSWSTPSKITCGQRLAEQSATSMITANFRGFPVQ